MKMLGTETLSITDCELIDSLRCFPDGVLPAGTLRELTRRGPRIQEEVLRRLDKVASDAGTGIGCIPRECFYCFGLLIAHPSVEQLPTLERLLRLDDETLDNLASDQRHDLPGTLIVEIAKASGSTEVMAWFDRMLEDDSVGAWSRVSLLQALPYLVQCDILPRKQAIDRLVGVLRQRSSQKYDLLSSFSLIELSKLDGTELDAFAHACFDQQQIDEDLYSRDDWQRDSDERTTQDLKLPELDPVRRIEWWHGFSKVAYSLDPFALTFETNPNSRQDPFGPSLGASETDLHIRALCDANDQLFPREAVEALRWNTDTEQVRERLIEVVYDGLRKAGGPDARASNGPFLALVLLISRCVQIPRGLLLSIVDLPEDSRMDLFGDAMDHAIVVALSQSLHGDAAPIDARIVDPDRHEMDRSILGWFYPLSSWGGHMTREDSIERLFSFWQSSHGDGRVQSELADSLLEALCMMSAQQHRDILLPAMEHGSKHFSSQQLQELLDDPSKGIEQIAAMATEIRDPMRLIETSVMFDSASLEPEPSLPVDVAPRQVSSDIPGATTTVRNTESSPRRNDACPCGSGKKYKKCCLRKQV